MSEMDLLIAAYNQAETEQTERLTAIYHLFKLRTGYKRMVFGGGVVWSNLNGEERNELPRLLAALAYPITDVE